MQFEQRRQAMLQLHLGDQQFYCLRCILYHRIDSISSTLENWLSYKRKPRSHMYCILSATALRLKNSCNQCNHCAIKNCIFRLQINWRLVGDNYPLKIGDQSATGRRLSANWLEMGCDWSATRWRLVGDRSAMSWRLTIEQTLCCVDVIMNKALISCYSMAISKSIMSYCLFLGYFLVRIYID